ncbi:MAG TPA: nitrilase-related carbon-nitrogen hydrolase [Chloroflexaceae bacterium]|nr:nitrilase-related carbon-nitrogen hydrolase [Chloroflexaceae bacterium]
MTRDDGGIPARPLRAAAVQMESAPGDKARNLATLERFVAAAAGRGVELIAFPECCLTGYWFLRNLGAAQLEALAEPLADGPAVRAVAGLARRYGLAIGAGFVERGPSGALHNSYLVALPDGAVHCHRKLHAFEHPAIESGSAYTVFDGPGGWRVGVLICYDNNLIENGRMTALLGADLVLAPHQTGGCRTRNPHLMGLIERRLWDNRHADPAAIERELRGDKGRGWLMRWLPSRAHDNGVFMLFANGVGVDDDEIRTGNAMILDPYGRILSETGAAADAMVVADLDPALLEHATGRGWIAARRPELYGPLATPTGRERDARELKFEE